MGELLSGCILRLFLCASILAECGRGEPDFDQRDWQTRAQTTLDPTRRGEGKRGLVTAC
jgi:hypothetical protein